MFCSLCRSLWHTPRRWRARTSSSRVRMRAASARASSAMLAPTVNTHYMNEHLRFISERAGADRHVVLVLDNAGWHVSKTLKTPENITLLPLPPYSPDFNPIEKLWSKVKAWLRRVAAKTFDSLSDAIAEALRAVGGEECMNYFKACGWGQK